MVPFVLNRIKPPGMNRTVHSRYGMIIPALSQTTMHRVALRTDMNKTVVDTETVVDRLMPPVVVALLTVDRHLQIAAIVQRMVCTIPMQEPTPTLKIAMSAADVAVVDSVVVAMIAMSIANARLLRSEGSLAPLAVISQSSWSGISQCHVNTSKSSVAHCL
jgi:hypothetical protein